jgi:hypothetical protein
MIISMKKLLIALLLLVVVQPCHAIDGKTLSEWCHTATEKTFGDSPTTFRDGYCMGMTEGVMALAKQRSLKAFCAPESTGQAMLLRTVLLFLDTHPERLKEQAEVLILDALGDAYPCQKSEPALEN